MKTEKTIQLELIGNSHIKEYVKASIGLAAFLIIVSLAVIGTHAGINYVNILQGVH